ncbi:hypothetical protein B0I35DRAFT_463493 [Stachybotrys elegans]|uniref:SAP domain-containing protein n=1 Tax=Stachybotrys elegans TaxID=80388 RepID=A0A8K0SN99_9HYPO|nr:hypothetical protein B0I35DRAFT_463493 [Stachybotrys elegans]
MAEYSSLRVPELKKLLTEKGLSNVGNKADLVARLQEHDKKSAGDQPPAENKEDEISYSDDEAAAPEAKPVAPAAETAPAEPAPAAAASTDAAEEKPAEPATEPAATEGEKEAEEPAQNFALGLSSTAADDEAKKRADRAKRFGIEEDDDTVKRAERAKRFGIDEKTLASSLDSALPDRPLKRGRGRGEGEGNRPGKRQTQDQRGGGRRSERQRRGGPGPKGDNRDGNKKASIFTDPAEKAKAEKRAARFAAA